MNKFTKGFFERAFWTVRAGDFLFASSSPLKTVRRYKIQKRDNGSEFITLRGARHYI
jgi:hypothetical protein